MSSAFSLSLRLSQDRKPEKRKRVDKPKPDQDISQKVDNGSLGNDLASVISSRYKPNTSNHTDISPKKEPISSSSSQIHKKKRKILISDDEEVVEQEPKLFDSRPTLADLFNDRKAESSGKLT